MVTPTDSCGVADGSCPAGCTAARDVDCKKALGSTCATDSECVGGFCSDRICCTKRCGLCERCTGAGGTCQSRSFGEADPMCLGNHACDGRSQCKMGRGVLCRQSEECLSGFCVDGVCCERACTTCESCNSLLSGLRGSCTTLSNVDDPGVCDGAQQICALGTCGEIDQVQLSTMAATATLSPTNSSAQGITVGRTGRLVGVRVRSTCRSGDSIKLTITALSATGPIGGALATASLSGYQMVDQLPPGEVQISTTHYPMQLFMLETPLAVTQGRQLAIILSSQADGGCIVNNFGFFERADAYPGPLFFTNPTSGNWEKTTGDLVFETVMAP
jgi:hypothetical protein